MWRLFFLVCSVTNRQIYLCSEGLLCFCHLKVPPVTAVGTALACLALTTIVKKRALWACLCSIPSSVRPSPS